MLISFFQSSTKTHCEVDNFAPSISSAIGSYLPQKYVWQTCIALHIAPRFVFLFLYKNFYETRLSLVNSNVKTCLQIALAFHLLELLSLLGLSLVSSQENFDIHKVCFVTFGVSSLVYFLLTTILWTRCGLSAQTQREIASLRYKKNVLKIFFIFGLAMSYFYYVHNEYCYRYIYSLFCICEYVIVVANMVFHMTAYYDFADVNLITPCLLNEKMEYQALTDINIEK